MNRYIFKNLVDPEGRVKEVEVMAWTPKEAVMVLKAMCTDLHVDFSTGVDVYCGAMNVSLN